MDLPKNYKRGTWKIFNFLKQENKEMHTSYIAMKNDMSWAYSMMYLEQLEEIKFVVREKRGETIYWRLTELGKQSYLPEVTSLKKGIQMFEKLEEPKNEK